MSGIGPRAPTSRTLALAAVAAVLGAVTVLPPAAAFASAAPARSSVPAAGIHRAPAPTVRDGARAYARGRVAEAEALLRRAAQVRPRDPTAWLWLGVVRFQRGDLAASEAAFAYAARLAPRDAAVLLWWGHVLARLDRTDEAVAAFRQALLARGTPTAHRLAEQALRALRPLPPVAGRPAGAAAPGWVTDVESYGMLARYYNPRLEPSQASVIAQALLGYSHRFNVDPRLVVALVVVESGFRPRAVSRAGAIGLGQLMPATARALGVNPWDPVQNLYGSIRYLRGNLDRFGWDRAHLALAAYNAGRGAVERYAGIPPYPETQWYVTNVTGLYRRLLAISGEMPELRRRLRED